MHRIAVWDRDKNAGRVVRPWRAFTHPQLGDVEVGGIDPRVGMWNPPPEEMPKICTDQAAHYLRAAALAPAVALDAVETDDAVAGADARHGHRRQSRLPAHVHPRLGEGADAQRAAVGRRPLRRLRACRSRSRASRDRPPRRLGSRPLRRLRCALLHAHPGHHRSAHAVVGRARPRRGQPVRIGSCRVGWTTRDIRIG